MKAEPTTKPRTERSEADREAAQAPKARYVVVATAGHIDHGKSALVQALTGIDPDRLKEEKERGITIELGFAHAAIGDLTVAFVDVPGHERFVKTMVAGVGGVDAVMLIVAADESVMPQTREHFDICRLLQLTRGVIAVTKADLVEDQTLDIVTQDIRDLVRGSFLEDAPIVPVSAQTGQGLDALRARLVALSAPPSPRLPPSRIARRRTGRPTSEESGEGDAPRLPVDRVFSMTGFGTIVTGTLQSGRLRVNDELVVLPGSRTVRVRGLHLHGAPQTEVGPRHRVAVNLAGVDVADITRGQTLAAPGLLTVTRRLDVEIDVLPSAHPLRHGERIRFHTGTADAFGRLVLVGEAGSPSRRGFGEASEIGPGARALVRIRLDSPVAITRGDRFIVRSASHAMTVAGGRVLDADPALRAPRGAEAYERLRILAAFSADDLSALASMVRDRGAKGLALGELVSRGGVPRDGLGRVASELERGHAIVEIGGRLVAAATVDDLSARLIALVQDFHRRDPLGDGLPREEARERLFARADPAVFEWVVTQLRATGTLIARDRLALSQHAAGLSNDERHAHTTLDEAYREGGLTPPDLAIAATGLDISVAQRMLELMVRQKALARIGGLVFHPDALARLKADVQTMKTSATARVTVDVATFKQRYGVSRKFAIPLLEWLDRERVTRRVGDVRVLL